MLDDTTGRPPTTFRIFLAFANIGATGFGGVLPIARHVLVDRWRLLSALDFAHLLTLCQLLPGPNIINLTVLYGTRTRGAAGAAAGLLGLLALPLVVILVLAALYREVADVPAVANAIGGVAIAAAGLIASLALRMIWLIRKSLWMVILAAIVFACMVLAGLPLLLIVVVAAPVGVLLAWMLRDA